MAPPSPNANYIDGKKLESCHVKRAAQHRTMKGLAGKGKTSVGWFCGLKLHLIVNQYGQLCNFIITPGHVSDNNGKVLQTLFNNLQGIFFGNKGYLTKRKQALADKGAKLITKVRRNMKKVLYSAQEKYFLEKRSIIETVFGLLSFRAGRY